MDKVYEKEFKYNTSGDGVKNERAKVSVMMIEMSDGTKKVVINRVMIIEHTGGHFYGSCDVVDIPIDIFNDMVKHVAE